MTRESKSKALFRHLGSLLFCCFGGSLVTRRRPECCWLANRPFDSLTSGLQMHRKQVKECVPISRGEMHWASRKGKFGVDSLADKKTSHLPGFPWQSLTFSWLRNQRHSVWKLLKMSHFYFLKLAFSINFCPIKIDLSGNTVWPQASDFQTMILFFLWFSNTVLERHNHRTGIGQVWIELGQVVLGCHSSIGVWNKIHCGSTYETWTSNRSSGNLRWISEKFAIHSNACWCLKSKSDSTFGIGIRSFRHSVWKLLKMSHLNFGIFHQFLVLLKLTRSCNTVWP